MKIAVVGAGLIGHAWAIVFARGGHSVSMFDADSAQVALALTWVRDTLADMTRYELATDIEGIASRISGAPTLNEALAGARYVQESIAEKLEPKQALFAEIEATTDRNCIFASSSSAIMPSQIFAKLKYPDRSLVAHPMNPPHLAPIVELCGSAHTSAEAISIAMDLMSTCGMSAIAVNGEIDGFILNRLQHALLNECFRLIESGHVSPADIDKTLKDGLALRWAFMGPVETIDLNAPGGVSDYMQRYGQTLKRIGESQKAAQDWTDKVTAVMETARREQVAFSGLADAQTSRDRRMMELLRLKKGL